MSQPPASQTRHERKSFGDSTEAAEFVAMLEKFERGELNADQYRQYRLSRGIYGQRQDGVQMVRVKIPQGVLSARQLRVLADVGERFSRGYGHVTTRQNVQFHGVKLEHVASVMELVSQAGLTTREACSHTVRNVAACPYAGVCHGSPFDVTPYAEAVTRHFLRAPLGSGLPRKFKIAVSGCADDCGQGAINDIGIVAALRDGQRGFRILAGGGTSTLPRSGAALHEFLEADDLLVACEAILRVFNAEGQRHDLKKARMKWAIQRLGWQKFQSLYRQHFDALKADGGRPLPLTPAELPSRPAGSGAAPPIKGPLPAAFELWRSRQVRPQAQAGYVTALVWLRLGDITSAQLRALADLAERFADGEVRTTQGQNLLFRWISIDAVGALWLELDRAGLGGAHADRLPDVVSCPGAETCRIAVTASRGVAQLLGEHLRGRPLGDEASTDIKVSGCPNGCGQHHIAAIGLQGAVRKLGDKLVPQYHLTIGGGIGATGAVFGRFVTKLPARRVPEAVDRLIGHFQVNRVPGESPRAYFQRLDPSEAKRLLADLAQLDEASAQPEDFVDLGSSAPFTVVDLDGECAV
jgi:sulfite reductase (NADPH) hemoprotein beta-component